MTFSDWSIDVETYLAFDLRRSEIKEVSFSGDRLKNI